MNENLKPTKIIIFYDDNCVLCNHSIQFLIKRDIQKQFLFSPLQGKLAKKLIDPNYIKKLDSFVIFTKSNTYIKGKAIKFIINNLKSLYFYKWILFIPNPILDLAYSLIGKIRYKVFGKSKNCLYLNEKLKTHFIV
jgi:predicted DCC family thiol-disulfide oxidoreductase YuxK